MVRVEEKYIKPDFISEKLLRFQANDALEEGSTYVFVSNNGEDFQRGSSTVTLNYYKLLGVKRLSISKV